MSDGAAFDTPALGWKGCVGIGLVGLILALCLVLSTCVTRVEVMRAKSPDGRLIASIFEINGGATTAFAYEVNVARNRPIRWNRAVAGFHGAIRSDCAYGVNLRWLDNDTLLISYKNARSTDVDPTVPVAGRTVRIVARAGIDDASAPCGGMEYGQQGRVAHVP